MGNYLGALETSREQLVTTTNRSQRGIVFIYCQSPQSRATDLACLKSAMAAARTRTALPICLYANAPVAQAVGSGADFLVMCKNEDFWTPRITISRWVPFDQWLYLDHDAKIVGDDWSFGFEVLDRGFDLALCSIMGEADKTCLGDSKLFPATKAVFPEMPRWAFYAQAGVIYARRSVTFTEFEDHWLSIHQAFGPQFIRLQPSFAVAHWQGGANLRSYILPPHFNYREGYRERGEHSDLPLCPRPRGEIQIVHGRLWFGDEAAPDDVHAVRCHVPGSDTMYRRRVC